MDEKTALTKGFNAGYWLEKYEPELSKIIQQSFGDQNHPYAEGFIKGSKEYEQEQIFSTPQNTAEQDFEIDRSGQSLDLDKPDKGMDFEK